MIANFLSALAYSSADFTFLADQDDIWHHKKAVTFSKMAQTQSPDVPTLTFSDARLIDEYNQEITSSFLFIKL
ncbi:glycosylltransferase [Aggregatibacter actinomycetemcomitans ANH9381]|nr:glycosylltransferase [Aggregatibacter actinomycetemcomitans ANH9381]